MTPSMKVGIAGVVLGLILLAILPWWAAVGIIIIAAAIPVGGYLALDKSQRRRLRAIRARQRAIGRELRRMYDNVAQEPVPDDFMDLLRQIDEAEGSKGGKKVS